MSPCKQSRDRTRVPHTCPNCGCIRHLEKATAARTLHCRRCHCQQIAPLGFAATAARFGQDFALRAAARWRIEQPSSLERQVEDALRQIPGLTWEREVAVTHAAGVYFVDFAVMWAGRRMVVEANGAFAHRNDTPDAQAARLQMLLIHFEQVITLSERELRQHRADLPAYLIARFE